MMCGPQIADVTFTEATTLASCQVVTLRGQYQRCRPMVEVLVAPFASVMRCAMYV